jgi:DNA-binding NtrC family response regulator
MMTGFRESLVTRRILVVDDDAASRKGLETLLAGWGYEVETAPDGEEALAKVVAFHPAVVISDLVMPRLDGMGLLHALHKQAATASVIILTAHGTIETAVSAVKDGAYDYLTKPVELARLRLLIDKALERWEAVQEVALLRRRVQELWGLGRLVGKSTAMQEIYRLIELAGPTTAPVLVCGESGTGKELVARTLHDRSPRARGPFVAVNCAAIPETLLESEILGHERGAFTGAFERRPGCFELANGGTLLLDEIAEMASTTQAKFLRVLQEGTVRRLGGKTEIAVDVRVLAATNKEPLRAVKDGVFREDLFYRLNVFSIAIPPLRERRDDIALLIDAFLEEFNSRYERQVKSVDDEARRMLLEHAWPGNARELRNVIERAVVVCDGDLVTARHLPREFGAGARPPAAPDPGEATVGTSLDEAEKRLILRTLEAASGNKTRAAEILGISVRTLHNKLHRYRS